MTKAPELGVASRRSAHTSARQLVGPSWLLGIAVVAVSALALVAPVLAMAVALIVVALAMPKYVMTISMAWVMLCRPGHELVQRSILGISVTELDALILLSVIAATSLRGKESRPGEESKNAVVGALLLWPAWLILRALLSVVEANGGASSFFDLRAAFPYMSIIPALALLRKYGKPYLMRVLCGVGYGAAVIAITVKMAVVFGYSLPAVSSLWLIDSLVVRPGGELAVVILAATALTGNAPWILRSRLISWILILAELAISQTLSIVIAILLGWILAYVIGGSRRGATGRWPQLVSIVGVVLVVAWGGWWGGSRFDLPARLSEDSAGYRFNEATAVWAEVNESPVTFLAGLGPGSQYSFVNPYSGVEEVKGDAHDVYLYVWLKTGLIGVMLYLAPTLIALVMARRRRDGESSATIARVASVAVVAVSVPFALSVPGAVAAMWTILLAGDRRGGMVSGRIVGQVSGRKPGRRVSREVGLR